MLGPSRRRSGSPLRPLLTSATHPGTSQRRWHTSQHMGQNDKPPRVRRTTFLPYIRITIGRRVFMPPRPDVDASYAVQVRRAGPLPEPPQDPGLPRIPLLFGYRFPSSGSAGDHRQKPGNLKLPPGHLGPVSDAPVPCAIPGGRKTSRRPSPACTIAVRALALAPSSDPRKPGASRSDLPDRREKSGEYGPNGIDLNVKLEATMRSLFDAEADFKRVEGN